MKKLQFTFTIAAVCVFLILAASAGAQEAGTPADAGAQKTEAPASTQDGPEVSGQVIEPETGMEAQAIEDKPMPAGPDLATPVFVAHEGNDPLGSRLAFRIKEIFNTASLFNLTGQDVSKIKLLVKTRTEFPGRPNLGSIYSATWIYQASENMLTHYLDSEMGFVPADGVESLAEELAARTEKVATRYYYLFE